MTLDELLTPADLRAALEADARTGLTATPKWLPPKYFYDDRGSRLFEEITRLPEYYPTRTEHSILVEHADEIASVADAEALLELGSGSSEKTRMLLDAMARGGRLSAYVPVDVSAGALRDAMDGLRRDYPDLVLHGAVADFDHHLDQLPAPGRRLVALLGGTLGNYPPGQRQTFLSSLAAAMRPGEAFLLGVDLVKDADRLVAAYDDSAGVTAEFNRNVIAVLNRELDGDLDPDDFEHVALWDAQNEWIEMRLRARRPIVAQLAALDLKVTFDAGEEIRTEISAKFRRSLLEPELAAAGLHPERWWSDPAGDFALVLARR
ncbi:L-histidine N(alpha)-methyltransferase [Nocardioides sp. Root151]|uniref:L-histidine N(alpha)-methyltransferase n=1 Tax=Nocardioides sp. Root151 TaxID=1736475 RepID=UPI00070251DA|nr:L-histidine N(alpha)-methyltransferase [Nocardioides sp. Root151]KQZ70641.1 dimethylhistidine N-methyltransferase [Nocardioides sp. Root151]